MEEKQSTSIFTKLFSSAYSQPSAPFYNTVVQPPPTFINGQSYPFSSAHSQPPPPSYNTAAQPPPTFINGQSYPYPYPYPQIVQDSPEKNKKVLKCLGVRIKKIILVVNKCIAEKILA